ncbi:MAG: 4Fe-4S binding protein [Candidatus Omnitrophota bacterium]
MRYPKLRELKEAITALVKGPYTSKFPKEPHAPYERFRGSPKYREEDCVGCSACFQVCPARAIEMKDEKKMRTLIVHWDICIFCGQCQANCITGKGIMLSNDFDLSTTGKRQELKDEVKKEFLACECCGENIACIDHIIWTARKLGPLIFSNASLMLYYLKNLGLSSPVLAAKEKILPKEEELVRFDRIKLLCPRCRREAVLKS